MTETKQPSEKGNKCCAGIDMSACCEQMSKMMAQFCDAGKDGFDFAAMMQKMGGGRTEAKKPAE